MKKIGIFVAAGLLALGAAFTGCANQAAELDIAYSVPVQNWSVVSFDDVIDGWMSSELETNDVIQVTVKTTKDKAVVGIGDYWWTAAKLYEDDACTTKLTVNDDGRWEGSAAGEEQVIYAKVTDKIITNISYGCTFAVFGDGFKLMTSETKKL